MVPPKHQPATIEACRRRIKKKKLVAVLERGSKMDFNLTGFFLGMPINLTAHSPQDLIKDWLPLLAVFLTAIFTYFITSSIQERNHRKDLKREVYFELIDVITNARKVYDDNRRNPLNEDPNTQTREDLDRMDKEIMVAYTPHSALWVVDLIFLQLSIFII
jgi:hypothetical protein